MTVITVMTRDDSDDRILSTAYSTAVLGRPEVELFLEVVIIKSRITLL
jgi:hypothetical protein